MMNLIKETEILFHTGEDDLYQNPSFTKEWLRHNLYFCFSASVLLSLLWSIGLIGTFDPFAAGQTLRQINPTKTYSIMLLFNLVFAFHLGVEIRKCDTVKQKENRQTALLTIFCMGNMVLASCTFFSTQKGSSFFFEYILVTMLIYLFPMNNLRQTLADAAANLASLAVITALIPHPSAWQDWVDACALHLFCITVSQIRWKSHLRYDSIRLQLERNEKILYGETRMDDLTGLLNRTALREDFKNYLSQEICLAILDIDGFKQINDTHGHVYGDRVLSAVGSNLKKIFHKPGENCYRYGGDEMLVISPRENPSKFRNRLTEFQELCCDAGNGIRIEVSIGYCNGVPRTETDLRSCIRIADRCLYAVKNDGKNGIAGRTLESGRNDSNEAHSAFDSMISVEELMEKFLAKHEVDWSAVYFDISHFTELSEQLGYRKGRWLLEQTAKRIRASFRHDYLVNQENDHFILYTTLPEEKLLKMVIAVQDDISEIIPQVAIVVRVGIYHHAATDGPVQLITGISNAKYACRRALENNSEHSYLCLFDEKMAKARNQETFVHNHLEEAMENGRIVPYYQPFIGSLSQKTCGFEALARWTDPERGLVSPAEFMPALESTQKAYRLDLYMLKCVCEDLKRQPALLTDDLFVTVNLSRSDFEMWEMPEKIDQLLKPYGFPKDLIQFEITESALSDSVRVHDAVLEMNRKGYSIWLDDFGVGQSSLHALQEYEVRGIKLDHSFFQHFQASSRSHTIIHSIVDLCHETGCLMIAEGVENAEQLWYAKQWGVNFIQGFYFSHPLPLKNLLESRFVKEITDNHDTAFYRPAANVNLSVPMERVFFAPDRTVIRFGKAVMERSGNHVTCLRINEGIRQLFHPYFVHPDLGEDLTDGTNLQETLLKAMKQADSRKDVIEFPIRLSDSLFHGQIAHLTEDGEKSTYVMALSNYGIANPLPSGNAAD